MSTQGDNAGILPLGRVQRIFLRACAVALMIWLLFYTITVMERYSASSSVQSLSLESWNMTALLEEVDKPPEAEKLPKIQRQRKLVLLWTDYFSSRGNWLPSTEKLQCPVRDCVTTTDRSLLTKSAAVIIHWRDVNLKSLPHCTPSETVQCPLWILFNEESPPHTDKTSLEALEGKIHWTMMYRKDSDVYAPYGKIVKRLDPKGAKIDFDSKNRLVCWLVSNCHTQSKREEFVNELKKHIDVDVYGKCGSMKCPHASAKDCYVWLSQKCKFYLSLENSNCRDYTTEKLYYALYSGMVPIVMGNGSNYSHLPQRSYINANDFPSPKDLAYYLSAVGNNRDLYLSHTWWRSKYEAKDNAYRWFCDLCEKLHSTNVFLVKPRRNLVSWWYSNACSS